MSGLSWLSFFFFFSPRRSSPRARLLFISPGRSDPTRTLFHFSVTRQRRCHRRASNLHRIYIRPVLRVRPSVSQHVRPPRQQLNTTTPPPIGRSVREICGRELYSAVSLLFGLDRDDITREEPTIRIMARSLNHVSLLCGIIFSQLLLLTVGQENLSNINIVDDYETTLYLDKCESKIYCDSTLLKTVQLARLNRDSKTFVDYVLKYDEDTVLQKFDILMSNAKNHPTLEQVESFVNENFVNETELVNVTLPDWKSYPRLMERVYNLSYKNWVKDLNDIWKTLARKMADNVINEPRKHSLIPVNQTFIIPGGRFREFYYWDSYWVIKGLLLSDMLETPKGMIENFLSIVDRYGFIPNGGRVYYLMRSQPPLLPFMIQAYYEESKDCEFVLKSLPILKKEFDFFLKYKSIEFNYKNKKHLMFRYAVNSTGPRPESYREDYEFAEQVDPAVRPKIYNNVKAAAESGWDFSARWFTNKSGGPSLNFLDIDTQTIIPVDLNAFIQKNARLLQNFYMKNKDIENSKYYGDIADRLENSIKEVFWNDEDGTWYDFDVKYKQQRKSFYPSNLTPLYTESYNKSEAFMYGEKATNYLLKNKMTMFPGGIPTSLDNSTQQWDFPNAWAPLQSIVVFGLHNTRNPRAEKLANELATQWLRSNYQAFQSDGKMYEKYDACMAGKSGGGGEYPVQFGFGWTNGVALEFLNLYPNASYEKNSKRDSPQNFPLRLKAKPRRKQHQPPSVWDSYRKEDHYINKKLKHKKVP